MTGPGLVEVEAKMRKAMDRGDWDEVARLLPTLDALDQPRPAPSLGGAALWYAEQGFHVFPLQRGSKIPLPGGHGCKDATSDTEQVRSWWRQHPHANIGLATGHLVDVVDFDGALGHESWGKLLGPDRPWMPQAQLLATVSTPRPGGLHAYVVATGQGNGAALAPGVDYRGAGGYVVAPPSRTERGPYTFLRTLRPDLQPW